MGRPIKADAAATKRRILEAAWRQFSDDGLQRTTIRSIAREASVNVATVHHYFVSKDNLHRACISEMYSVLSQFVAEIAGPVLAAGSPQKSMELAVRLSYRFALEHRRSVRFMQRVLLDSGELGEEVREKFMRPQLLHGARLAGIFGLDPREARFVLASINYLLARYVLNSDEELAIIADTDPSDPEAAHQAVEDHLVRVTLAILWPPK